MTPDRPTAGPAAAPPKPRPARPKPPAQVGNILIFQGGGALGAYECGVYKVLAERLDTLSMVAGTSVGALTAGVVARCFHEPDRGVGAVERLWQALAFPAMPWPELWSSFPGLEYLEAMTASLSSVFFGNPRLFEPALPWGSVPFPAPYSTQPMRDTAADRIGTYRKGSSPRLIVTALHLETSALVAFDSDLEDIVPEHIVASGSLPPGFPATEIGGQHYWDGGLWSNTPVPEVLAALRNQPGATAPDRYQIYIVDVFPKDCVAPDQPERETALRETLQVTDGLPVTLTRIQRPSLAFEQLGGAIDFSPRRIEGLIAQGEQDARAALATG